jgi:hypothetical protein
MPRFCLASEMRSGVYLTILVHYSKSGRVTAAADAKPAPVVCDRAIEFESVLAGATAISTLAW